MIVNSDTLAAIRTDFQAIFLESYAAYKANWQRIATEFPSGSEFLDLSWLGATPIMKEWLDEKIIEGLRRFRYAITNKDWEATLGVKRKAIEDDTLGVYRPQIQDMAGEAKVHTDILVTDLLNNGEAGVAFDGGYFFADTRSIGDSGNIDNLLAGTGTTQAQFATDFGSARAALIGFKNDRGRPANIIRQFLTIVPPALQGVAETTFNAASIAGVADNVLKGASDLWVNEMLTDPNDFFVLNVAGALKPLAVSMRKASNFLALDSPTSDHVFKHGEYLYSVEERKNVGYLLPWRAVKVKNT
jgi:phage major head subunit gpT-like protein